MAFSDQVAHTLADVDNHISKLDYFLSPNHLYSVTGDYPGIGAGKADRQIKRFDRASQRAAVVNVDDRIARGAKDVTEVKNIGFGEVHEGIAICVRRWCQEYPHLLATEVEGDAFLVSDEGSRLDRRLRIEPTISSREPRSLLEHTYSHIVMGKNQHTVGGKWCISTNIGVKAASKTADMIILFIV